MEMIKKNILNNILRIHFFKIYIQYTYIVVKYKKKLYEL